MFWKTNLRSQFAHGLKKSLTNTEILKNCIIVDCQETIQSIIPKRSLKLWTIYENDIFFFHPNFWHCWSLVKTDPEQFRTVIFFIVTCNDDEEWCVKDHKRKKKKRRLLFSDNWQRFILGEILKGELRKMKNEKKERKKNVFIFQRLFATNPFHSHICQKFKTVFKATVLGLLIWTQYTVNNFFK